MASRGSSRVRSSPSYYSRFKPLTSKLLRKCVFDDESAGASFDVVSLDDDDGTRLLAQGKRDPRLSSPHALHHAGLRQGVHPVAARTAPGAEGASVLSCAADAVTDVLVEPAADL